MKKLILKDIISGDCDYIDLIEIYNNPENKLKVVGNKYVCLDDALSTLFMCSGIFIEREIDKSRNISYNLDYNLIGCCYGDYLSTLELRQDERLYRCQTFCMYDGKKPSKALLLANVQDAYANNEEFSDEYGIREFAYALYKQEWLDDNTNKDMRLDSLKNYYSYRKECVEEGYSADSYNKWLEDVGFDTGCYVCFEEFCNNEYLDEEYIYSLLDNSELIEIYKKDVEKFI